MKNIRKKININEKLERISFATYISVVNYFNKTDNACKYSYGSDRRTGNKLWKDSSNKVVAKRILNTDKDEEYLVDKQVLQLLFN